MERCIKTNFQSPVRALEIGTWFGRGSTQIWLRSLPAHSSLILIDSWRPYISKVDMMRLSQSAITINELAYKSMDDLSTAALASTLQEVRRFESSRSDISITIIRGKSQEVVEYFKDGLFDYIYIDGSHYYEDVKRDLAMAKRLANPKYSIICGDDYDLPYDDRLFEIAKANTEKDNIDTPLGSFHPGVFLAVHEQFGRVNMESSFWWVICTDGKFLTGQDSSENP